MTSTLTQSALFAAGLLIGVSSTAIVYKKSTTSQPKREQEQKTIQKTSNLDPSNPILKYGNPGPLNDFFIRKAYAMAFDRRMRNPAWTAEHLTLQNIQTPIGGDQPDRSHSKFHEDQAIPNQFRAKLSDYFRSGYDRGHMVPAADAKMSQEAMNETFILSNIAPQVGEGFNRDYWAHLENFTRQLTNSFSDLYVFTIPLYLPKLDPITKKNIVSYEVIGNPPNVAVPTHFAKVIYGLGGKVDPNKIGSLGAFVLPNEKISNDIPLINFKVPIEAIEKSAGLVLFPDEIKSTVPKLCESVKCDMVIRNFDQARKQVQAGGGDGGGRRQITGS
ncbi:hypothetical protein CROQUDRAFT_660540 [Cronartium quercuum f. sp. fusiforme G11]|uniref:Endonuclease n=1 Tax=Cronartium quercuum f. sp. fusiforme G11 TaxID=708437 RepID=A0A9P6NH98_9BASI|nr:hypothetical protein CROQUDRAFT_660540 [Cronartium quercuum f. sp. fusiforme G11]